LGENHEFDENLRPCALRPGCSFSDSERTGDPTRSYGVPLIYDLHVDPKEATPLNSQWYHNGWIRWPAGQHLVEHIASLQKEPPIRPGTPDPYTPPN